MRYFLTAFVPLFSVTVVLLTSTLAFGKDTSFAVHYPKYPDSEVAFSLRDPEDSRAPISEAIGNQQIAGDMICNTFGYKKMVPGGAFPVKNWSGTEYTLQYNKGASGSFLLATSVDPPLELIVCKDRLKDPKQLKKIYVVNSGLIHPNSNLPFSRNSHGRGVCKALEFDDYVIGSIYPNTTDGFAISLKVDLFGEIERVEQEEAVGSIMCYID